MLFLFTIIFCFRSKETTKDLKFSLEEEKKIHQRESI